MGGILLFVFSRINSLPFHFQHVYQQPKDMCHHIDRVYLPLEKLAKCQVCREEPGSKLCSACGERSYCSTECQKLDWRRHRVNCGQTDQINLEEFYPFFSWMHASSHVMMPIKPPHPALMARIVNNPDVPATQLPDGSWARLFELDDTQPMSPMTLLNPMKWFSRAQSPKVARKLFRRITYSGYQLPILTAIATAILTEMYTTTSGAEAPGDRRIRLRYRSVPISDFGIAAGSVKVAPQDRLAFRKKSDGSIIRGQDPDDHYWIYFTTAKGEEIILECGMFPFNMCGVVDTDPYVPPNMPTYPEADVRIGYAPSLLIERVIRKGTPTLHTERKRLSILRNPELHRAVKVFAKTYIEDLDDGVPPTAAELKPFYNYMEALSGRPLNITEKHMFANLASIHGFSMHYILCQCNQEWRNFPKEPQLGIEYDSSEMDISNGENTLTGIVTRRMRGWNEAIYGYGWVLTVIVALGFWRSSSVFAFIEAIGGLLLAPICVIINFVSYLLGMLM